MTSYYPGQAFETTVTFRDFDNAPKDPTTITFAYRAPDGTETPIVYPAAGITKPGTGVYSAVFTATTEGAWWSRWEATGAVVSANEEAVQVRASMFV
jgi:hypothetical protein